MQRSSRVTWAPAAREDLLDAWAYFSQAANPDIADAVLRKIKQAADLLNDNPLIGRLHNELSSDPAQEIRIITARPYLLVYHVDADGVQMVRVLHARRDIFHILKSN